MVVRFWPIESKFVLAFLLLMLLLGSSALAQQKPGVSSPVEITKRNRTCCAG